MGTRGSAHPARWATAAGLLFSLLTARAATAVPGAGDRSGTRRAVRVLVLADPALRKDESWKVEIYRAVSEASLALEELSGLSLRIKAFAYGEISLPDAPETGDRRPTAALRALGALNRHVKEAGRGPGELVIGLVPEGPEGTFMPGVMDYLQGTAVLKYLKSRGGIKFVLLHEVLHIFGAIDLETPGSVMSRKAPTFRIDGFTKAIVRINKDRSFLTGEFPLAADRIAQAIDLYVSRRALGVGEGELTVCLNALYAAQARTVDAQTRSLR